MKAPVDPERPESPPTCSTLDEALEWCVQALERGEEDIESLPSRFPQWEREIEEFLGDWGGMENLVVELSDSLQPESPLDGEEVLPREFGEFELQERIGVGGMGVIYRARQKSLDRLVAIKILRCDPADTSRFRIEAEAAAALSHPNIVAIHEVGITDGKPWLCMQLIDGCNLKQYIRNTLVTPEDAARLTRTIAISVSHAHQRGILHRDLKPANVLLDSSQQPFVTDFGLAKLIEQDADLTESGTILGTPGFMSPEQATGKSRNLTVSTDIYGLGALLYALLTGDAPFQGDSSIEVLRRVIDEPVASPRLRNPAVDRDLATVCLKCLEKSPERRYPSAAALADDLERYLDGQPVLARPVPPSERFVRWCQRNPVIAGLSGAVIVLMFATTFFATFLAWSERNSRLLVEANAKTESGLRKAVTSSLELEKQATRNALRTQVNLLNSNAIWQAKNNNVGEALLWFTEAAALSADKPETVKQQLIHFETWLNQHPIPVAAMLMPNQYNDIEALDEIQFNRQHRALMYRSRNTILVWDYGQDSHWHLNDVVPNLTYAIWAADGSSIFAGCRDGQIFEVDPVLHKPVSRIQCEGAINRLVWLGRPNQLGVAAGNLLSVYDVASEALAGTTIQLPGTIVDLSFNKEKSRLVCTDSSRRATVLAVDDGKLRELFHRRTSYYSVLDGRRSFMPRFIKEGLALLVRVAENQIEAFDSETGEPLGPIPFTSPVYSHSVSDDGELALSGGFNEAQLIRFGNPAARTSGAGAALEVAHRDGVSHDNRVSAVSIGAGGLFATGGWNNEVRLWRSREPRSRMNLTFDLPERVVPWAILAHQNRVRRIEFTPDAQHLVTIQMDGLIRVWRIPDFQPIGRPLTVQPGGTFVKPVDETRWMTSGISQWSGHMESVSLYAYADVAFSSSHTDRSDQGEGHLLDAACSPDGSRLVTLQASTSRSASTISATDGSAGSVRFWTLPAREPIGQPIPMPSEPRGVVFRPDGQQVAVCTARMEILLIDSKTREIDATLRTYGDRTGRVSRLNLFPQNPINEQVIFTPDGKLLIAWSTRHRGLGVWDVAGGQLKFPRVHVDDAPLAAVSLSPDGRHLAMAGGQSMDVTILNLESGELDKEAISHPSFVHSVQFSPDGNLLLSGCRDGHARLIDWRSKELLMDQLSHDADIVAAVFTPDSKFLLTLGLDDQLRIWHAAQGELAARPIGVPTGSSQLLVSKDSRHVIVAGGHVLNVDLGPLHGQPGISLSAARQVSELLANKTIVEGNPRSISAEEWMRRWRAYSGQPADADEH